MRLCAACLDRARVADSAESRHISSGSGIVWTRAARCVGQHVRRATGRNSLAPLARRIDELPELRVRLFVHVGREWRDTAPDSELLREFGEELGREWPGCPSG